MVWGLDEGCCGKKNSWYIHSNYLEMLESFPTFADRYTAIITGKDWKLPIFCCITTGWVSITISWKSWKTFQDLLYLVD